MQVYMEQITDLIVEDFDELKDQPKGPMNFKKNQSYGNIVKDGLQIREDPKTGIFVKGLKQIKVNSEEELLNLIKYGSRFRITNETSMNKKSSRSHAILQILVEQKWIETENNDPSTTPMKKVKKFFYFLNFLLF
mgnify:CR=1 FL=1